MADFGFMKIGNRRSSGTENEYKNIQRFSPTPDYGLSEDQARERLEAGLYNKEVQSPTKTTSQIIIGNIFTYFNLIFFVIAAALIIVGSYNNLMFMVIVLFNLAIGTVQEINAKRKLDKLVILKEPIGTVIREGNIYETPTNMMVLDDIVIFRGGNQIFADAIVLEGEILVNESLVTGESDEIQKKLGDLLLSGSFVINGECRARLDNVGENSFAAKLTLAAKKSKKQKPAGMMKSLTRLLQIIGVSIIPVGALLYWRQIDTLGLSVKESVENTTGALVGMIPAGLYLLVSVALAASVVRIAQQRTVVHDFNSVETLARVDLLCLDKTGTITENHMLVTDLLPVYDPDFDKGNYNTPIEKIESILSDYASNMPSDNSTMQAIKDKYGYTNYRKAMFVQPFSSKKKYSLVSFDNDEIYVLGAPEILLSAEQKSCMNMVQRQLEDGKRILLLTKAAVAEGNQISGQPLAFIALENPIKATAKETFAYFASQNVKIKVISGDNPQTASTAAIKAGIIDAGNYIDATTLNTYEKIIQAADKYTVFGRVSPEQKRQLIRSLQKAGHTVGMTGDGVNDVLALKAADCSIAMASGSDVAAHVSDLVLLDSDFDSMPLVVAEGRRVINNIERTASLFLVKNILSFFLAIISVIAIFAYPLNPANLSLVSFLTIGAPSFFLALEPNSDLVKGRFLQNVLYRALPASLTNLMIVNILMLFSFAFPVSADEISTVAALLIVGVGFIMLWRVSTPFNWQRKFLFVSLIIMLILILVIVPGLFSLEALTFGSKLILFVLALLIPSAMWAFTKLSKRIAEAYNKYILPHTTRPKTF